MLPHIQILRHQGEEPIQALAHLSRYPALLDVEALPFGFFSYANNMVLKFNSVIIR
jgi:hypothetical protein